MSNEKILVVEDEEDIQEVLRYNLEKSGYRPICLDQGETAVAVVRKELPSLILLDIMLPGIDGLELIRRIRTLEKIHSAPHLPIATLTVMHTTTPKPKAKPSKGSSKMN